MAPVWVAVFTSASADDGESLEDVRAFSSRARAERFIAGWFRVVEHGRIERRKDRWFADAPAAQVREDSDGAIVRYVQLLRREVDA